MRIQCGFSFIVAGLIFADTNRSSKIIQVIIGDNVSTKCRGSVPPSDDQSSTKLTSSINLMLSLRPPSQTFTMTWAHLCNFEGKVSLLYQRTWCQSTHKRFHSRWFALWRVCLCAVSTKFMGVEVILFEIRLSLMEPGASNVCSFNWM